MSATPINILKQGTVVIMLRGRFAGKKGVIVSTTSDAKKGTYALVAGMRTCPRNVTKKMTDKTASRRSTIRPFIKLVNVSHLMPTRHTFPNDLAKTLSLEWARDESKKNKAMGEVGKLFKQRLLAGRDEFFFTKLQF